MALDILADWTGHKYSEYDVVSYIASLTFDDALELYRK
jgi:hypothetical protein